MPRLFTSCLSAFTAIALLSACSTSKTVPVASPQAVSPSVSPSAIASAQPKQSPRPKPAVNSNIGKRDQTGTVIKLDTPNRPECHRKYQSVKIDSFENCLVLGMTYVQVANVLGGPGELQAEAGNTQIWQWNDGAGRYATASFSDGYMVSRSQIGLVPD